MTELSYKTKTEIVLTLLMLFVAGGIFLIGQILDNPLLTPFTIYLSAGMVFMAFLTLILDRL
jgi:hypothetical protein